MRLGTTIRVAIAPDPCIDFKYRVGLLPSLLVQGELSNETSELAFDLPLVLSHAFGLHDSF